MLISINTTNNTIDSNENIASDSNTAVEANTNTTTSNNTSEETNITNPEEKAISIVKKDWGNDPDVYFSVDGVESNGIYLVGVRDKETTYVKYWYSVNLSTETFTIKAD